NWTLFPYTTLFLSVAGRAPVARKLLPGEALRVVRLQVDGVGEHGVAAPGPQRALERHLALPAAGRAVVAVPVGVQVHQVDQEAALPVRAPRRVVAERATAQAIGTGDVLAAQERIHQPVAGEQRNHAPGR